MGGGKSKGLNSGSFGGGGELKTFSRGTHSFQYADFFRDHNKLADASSIYISKYILYLKLLKRLQLQPLTLVNPEISIVSPQSLIKYNQLNLFCRFATCIRIRYSNTSNY